MNANNKNYLIVILILLFSNINNLQALGYIKQNGGLISYDGDVMTQKVRNGENSVVFCVEKSKPSPNYGVNNIYIKRYCENEITLYSDRIRASLGEIIKAIKNDKQSDTIFYYNKIYYYGMQEIIDKFLHNYVGDSVNTNISGDLVFNVEGNNYDFTTYYNNAINTYNTYDGKFEFNTTKLTFSYDANTNSYISNILNLTNNIKGTINNIYLKIGDMYISGSEIGNYVDGNNGYRIIIPISYITDEVNIEIGISTSVNYNLLQIKECEDDYQSIAEDKTIVKTIEKTAKASGILNPKTDTCQSKFLNVVNDKNGRIKLYQEYLSKGKTYNNLLNFNETDANKACSYKKCSDSINSDCLYFYYSQTNNSNDFSCYNDVLKSSIGDIDIGYCNTSIKFENTTISLPLTGISGQFLLKDKAGVATITKNCYTYDSLNGYKINNVSNYITNMKLNNDNLLIDNDKEIIEKSNLNGIINFEGQANYYYPDVYVLNSTGKQVNYNECIKKINNKEYNICKNLGKGILSKFINNENILFEFMIKIPNTNREYADYKECEINTKDELIIPDIPTDKDNLQLEFRLIDTKNPFPGSSGSGRIVGSNWCSSTTCDFNNEIVKENICLVNNSYNATKQGYKYKVILNKNSIEQIKKYNKSTTYDDYNLICDDTGHDCTSLYLDELEKNGILEIRQVPNKINPSYSVCTNY